MQTARWSIAVAAAALIALPIAAAAQSTPPSQPPVTQSQQPPAQPPEQQPPATPPAAPAGQADAAAAKTHLSLARATLSQLTTMPEAAKLQGDARTQVSQLISNFNALITTQSEWREAYAKVDANLTSLIGGEPPAADQPVGTSGSATLDPAIRTKLTEFRTHLKAFESAAGGGGTTAGDPMPPANPTPATTNPATPATPPNPASATPPSTPENPSTASNPEVKTSPNVEALKELEAIATILNNSKSGALTSTQTNQIKQHLETLRTLLNQK